MTRILYSLGVLSLALLLSGSYGTHLQTQHGTLVGVLSINGAVKPATADYIVRGLQRAQRRGAAWVLLELTPAGVFDNDLRNTIQAIRQSPLPVVAYANSGSGSGSAAAYLLAAAHVAAMAPDARLSVLELQGNDTDEAASLLHSLTQLRSRSAQWLTKTGPHSAGLSATEARQQGAIDLVALDRPDLLRQLANFQLRTEHGSTPLATERVTFDPIAADWINHVIALLTLPAVSYGLMLIVIALLIVKLRRARRAARIK